MYAKEIYGSRAAVVLVLTHVLFFPLVGLAGSLEPSAAPAPTMKTLDQVPPTLSQKLSAAQRFELVLDGAAVLDKETGLVWEQSPSTVTHDWLPSIHICNNKEVGGRKGWHLPTIEQLASLVDTSSGPPTVPAGHPFSNVQSSFYWSATTSDIAPPFPWYVNFSNGYVDDYNAPYSNYVWCVRGGQSHDAY